MRRISYENRAEAAAALCSTLLKQPNHEYGLVLGLCRGGVPLAEIVAEALGAPLEVLIVRKLPTPGNPELAMGAISEFGAEAINSDVLNWVSDKKETLARTRDVEVRELQRRAQAYRSGRPPASLSGKRVLVVDDGAATGATALAAVRAARAAGALMVDVAIPVASHEACAAIQKEADTLTCPWQPEDFMAVDNYYRDFPQISDAEVLEILQRAQVSHAHFESRRFGDVYIPVNETTRNTVDRAGC